MSTIESPYPEPKRRLTPGHVVSHVLGRGRLSPLQTFALVSLLAVTVLALLVPLVAPHGTAEPVGEALQAPSADYWLGTDQVGRDLLSRSLFGLRSTWFSALAVIVVGMAVGTAVGLVAGARGGWIDAALMRTTDVFLALPGPVLAIAVAAALGPSLINTLIAVSIVWWAWYARIVRGEIRTLGPRPHVEAARLAGASGLRLAFRHLLPGAVPAILVTASLDVGNIILTLAALSFLGLGAQAPAPELGAMTAQGLPYLLGQWWVPIVPALFVFALTFLSNLGGDALRDLMGDR